MAQKAEMMLPKVDLLNECAIFSKGLNPRNIEKSVSDIRIPFESSFWISVSGCKHAILPDIQPTNGIVIISDSGHASTTSLPAWSR